MNPNYYAHPIEIGFNTYYIWGALLLVAVAALLGQLRYRLRNGRIMIGGVTAATARGIAAFGAVLFAVGGVLKESHVALIQCAYNLGLVDEAKVFCFLIVAVAVAGALFYLTALAAIRKAAHLRYQRLKRQCNTARRTKRAVKATTPVASIGTRQSAMPAVQLVKSGRLPSRSQIG